MASDIVGMSVRDTSELRAATLEIAQIDEFLRSGAEAHMPAILSDLDRGGDVEWLAQYLARRRTMDIA
jgi:hypothetical protein